MQRKTGFLLSMLAATITSLCLTSTASAETVLKAPRTVVWQDFLGVNAQFQYFTPDIYQKQMAQLDQLGLNWVRLTIHWPIIEPVKDQYDLTALDGAMAAIASHNYNTVAYLVGSATFDSSAPPGATSTDQYPPADFSIFAARMAALAQRYPQVANWQVWNEPNIIWLPKEDPAGYYNLLTTTASAIRATVPNKNIVTAGMAYYSQMHSTPGYMLQDMLDMGLASQNIIAAYHPYSQYPEGDSIPDQDFLVQGNNMNTLLHNNGVSQVWATEFGWSSYAGPVEMQAIIGVDGQADYTLRRLALMSAMDYQRIFIFNLSDLDARASDRDQYYGLVDLNANPKPVYNALRNFLTITGPSLSPADRPALNNIPDDLYAVPWTRADGQNLLMIWSASGSNMQLQGVTSATLYDPMTGTQQTLLDPQNITVPLKPTLQLLVWGQ